MRHFINKTKPAKVVSILDYTTCDLCGEIAKRGNWESSSYEVGETEIETTIRQRDGKSFPEGGSGTQYIVDMCPQCFKEKLIPWLETQGCSAKRKDWEW